MLVELASFKQPSLQAILRVELASFKNRLYKPHWSRGLRNSPRGGITLQATDLRVKSNLWRPNKRSHFFCFCLQARNTQKRPNNLQQEQPPQLGHRRQTAHDSRQTQRRRLHPGMGMPHAAVKKAQDNSSANTTSATQHSINKKARLDSTRYRSKNA